MTEPKKDTFYCSFCRAPQHEMQQVVAGMFVFICDRCVERYVENIQTETGYFEDPSHPLAFNSCSFCGNSRYEGVNLFKGQRVMNPETARETDAFICNECVELCRSCIDAGKSNAAVKS